MAVKRLRMLVSGRVQGVGYRYFTTDVARAQRLTGWVRNCPEGQVELEAQGEEPALAALQAALRDGPPLAQVTELDVDERPVVADERGFRIRH